MKQQLFNFAVIGGTILILVTRTHAATDIPWIDNNTNLTFYGDLRLRYESDWDSQTTAGAGRVNRERGRIRVRAELNYQLADAWSFGTRVRTGNAHSQQSPHLTFTADDHIRDTTEFVADRYFVQFKEGGFTGWAGRNTTPFWQQNEMFWDEDVTPTGLAASYDMKVGDGKMSLIGGAFYLPDGGYDLNGQMVSGQIKYSLPVKASQFTVAAGLHFMNGEQGARNLLNRNGDRDYLIGVASAQWSVPVKGIPFALGVDVMNNFQDYDATDVAPFPAADTDETFGYVLSAQLGQLKKRHDWLVGYYYAHIETFAVNASYAQDDWARFGNATQSALSDIKGHEVRLAYALSKQINLMARAYFVEAITTVQDGNRFRVDLNWKF